MADRFAFDEDDAQEAGERTRDSGERLLDAHKELLSVLERFDGCWGEDSPGKAFAESYVALADQTRMNTEIIALNLSNVGEYVRSVVEQFVEVDEDNARELDELHADNVKGWES